MQESIKQLYEQSSDSNSGSGSGSSDLLARRQHLAYLERGIERLSSNYTCLDASKPWLCYWILHARDLLLVDVPLTEELAQRAISTIASCQHPKGGYGGGPGQLPHLACTFAAISALAIIGTAAAYESIDRPALFAFLSRMKQPDGSFTVHEDGEVDVRGSYSAIAAASLTGLLTDELRECTAKFVKSCQTFEGGFGAVPFAEAHAGYTYCAMATLAILDDIEDVDLHALDRFAVMAQCPQSGGFRGRTHKLVDGCYSFWAGALFPLMRRYCPASYFDSLGLQRYLLICCQEATGGLRDKPGKYHYNLYYIRLMIIDLKIIITHVIA